MGVEVSTERLWRARRRRGPGAARLRQHARPRARRLLPALDSLKAAFGPHVVATEIPIGAEHEVARRRRPDRHEGLRLRGRRARTTPTEVEIPEELRAQAEEYREKLMDEVAENSDELMERYLEGEEIDHEEIVTVLKQGVTDGQIFPVTCGVATRTSAPTACSRRWSRTCPRRRCAAPLHGRRRRGRGGRDRRPTRTGELVAYVFKTLRRPLRRADQPLPRLPRHDHAPTRRCVNVTRREKERIGQLGQPLGKELDAGRPSSAPATSARSPS